MKKIIIVRHGDYQGSDINERGREQMERLARKFGRLVSGKQTIILSSTAPRARQSAEILARDLDIDMELHETLLSEGEDDMHLKEVMNLIAVHEVKEILIIVTHLEYSAELPKVIGEKIGATGFPESQLSKGDAYVIDCEKKTCDRAAFL